MDSQNCSVIGQYNQSVFAVLIVGHMGGFSGNVIITGSPAAQIGGAAALTTEWKIVITPINSLFTNRATKRDCI